MTDTKRTLLPDIDARHVGSICADSSTYNNISDVLEMRNLVSDIESLLQGKMVAVGKSRFADRQLSVKFYKVGTNLVGFARCLGAKVYQSCNIDDCGTEDFAWFYIGLLSKLAENVRAKLLLKPDYRR